MKRSHTTAFHNEANIRPLARPIPEIFDLEVANPLDTSGIEDDVDRRVLLEIDRAISFLDDPMPVLVKRVPETKPSYYILHYDWGPIDYMLDFDRFSTSVRDIPQVRKTAIGKRGLYIHVARHCAIERERRVRQVAYEQRGAPVYNTSVLSDSNLPTSTGSSALSTPRPISSSSSSPMPLLSYPSPSSFTARRFDNIEHDDAIHLG